MDEEKKKQEPQSDKKEEQSGYHFLKQTTKKRPINVRAHALKALGVLLGAALFGVVASFVFAAMRPVAETAIHGKSEPQVTIPADEEPGVTSASSGSTSGESLGSSSSSESTSSSGSGSASESPSSESTSAASTSSSSAGASSTSASSTSAASASSSSASSSNTGSASATLTGTESGSAGNGDDPSGELPPTELTLDQYRQLHDEMMETADLAEMRMVRVDGVRSELDYFENVQENRAQASGLLIAQADGTYFVLTDRGVVEGAEKIYCVFADGTSASAELVRADENTGLAVLKTAPEGLDEELVTAFGDLSLGNSYPVTRGEPVLALGYPTGYADAVVYGMVTSVANTIPGVDAEYQLLTTDIEGAGENSSGILVNLKGEVIGVITGQVAKQEGASVTALAISRVKPLIERLSNGRATAYAGVRGQTVTKEISERTEIPMGLLVTGVETDSPAMLAGLMEFDVITQLDGQAVLNMNNFASVLAEKTQGQLVEVTAMRRGADGFAEIKFRMEILEK